MNYNSKLVENIVNEVSEKSGLSKEHVYIIYNSIENSIQDLLKLDVITRLDIPIIGSFKISTRKLNRLLIKLDKKLEYKSLLLDNILSFNFNLYSSIKYYIAKYSNK